LRSLVGGLEGAINNDASHVEAARESSLVRNRLMRRSNFAVKVSVHTNIQVDQYVLHLLGSPDFFGFVSDL
jgi:hypothetical protein